MHTYAHLVAVATHRVKEGLQDNISDNGEPVAAVGHSVRLAIVKSVALTDGENREKKGFCLHVSDMWLGMESYFDGGEH